MQLYSNAGNSGHGLILSGWILDMTVISRPSICKKRQLQSSCTQLIYSENKKKKQHVCRLAYKVGPLVCMSLTAVVGKGHISNVKVYDKKFNHLKKSAFLKLSSG